MKSLPTYTNSMLVYLGMTHDLRVHKAFTAVESSLMSQSIRFISPSPPRELIDFTNLINGQMADEENLWPKY